MFPLLQVLEKEISAMDTTAIFFSIWWIPVALRILVVFGIASWVLKKISGMHSRTRRFFLQFLICTILAVLFGLLQGNLIMNTAIVPVVIIGLFNGFAAFCQWKALEINLSKTALFTFWDDIIAMLLSLFILNESGVLNAGIVGGIILSFCAIIGFAVKDYRKKTHTHIAEGKTERTGRMKFYLYVGIYSVIWGAAVFFMRYFALHLMPVSKFLPAWYFGSFITATGILLLYKEQGQSGTQNLKTVKEKTSFVLWSTAASIVILAGLGITYWSYQLTPLIVVQPLYLVGEMVVPAIIGLFIFNEKKEYSPKDWILMALGIAGGLVIAMNFK